MATTTTYGISLLRAMSADVAPYFRTYLMALIPVETEQVPTAAVDKYARVYWNRAFFASMTVDEGAFVVLHEMMHLWLHHAQRAHAIGVTNYEVWNIAADCEINRTLATMKLVVPGTACLPNKFGMPDNLRAEEYYDLLMKQVNQQQQQQGQSGQGQGQSQSGQSGNTPPSGNKQTGQTPGSGKSGGPDVHGSGTGDKPGPWEKPGSDPDIGARSSVDIKITEEQTARDICESNQKKPGSVPAGMLRRAEDILAPPVVKWDRLLYAAVSQATNTTYGYDERTFKRINPVTWSMGGDVFVPTMESYRPDVACVLDTSGSMSQKDLTEGLREIQGVCRQLDAPVTVYTVDTQASAAQIVTRASDVKLVGGGGTDMSYGLEHAYRAARTKPHIIIVLTDGYTDWPSGPPAPGVKVIIVITSNGTDSAPKWATSVKMDS